MTRLLFIVSSAVALLCCRVVFGAMGLVTADLYKIRWAEDVRLAPDGKHLAYTVVYCDQSGPPSPKTFVMSLATRQSKELHGSAPTWSPDGRRVAYLAQQASEQALMVALADGSEAKRIGPVVSTNHSLPAIAANIAWSPDSRQVAFISSTPGPEADANGDPMVITRYLYKPSFYEGLIRFDDNRRTHLFVANIETGEVRQLTRGDNYEHSIDWSPDGQEILFLSNHSTDPDRIFNYDIFAAKVEDGSIRRITDTINAEYAPVWSPDGKTIAYLATKRPLTSSETTMEDTHVWLANRDGSNRREIGASIDNRQYEPRWSADGRFVYCLVRERGSNHIYRISAASGKSESVVGGVGAVHAWSLGRDETLAYVLRTPSTPSELFIRTVSAAPEQLVDLNYDWLHSKAVAEVETIDFKSFDGMPIQAFLTHPLEVSAGSRYPMIVTIHGGPHYDDGPNFNRKTQIYASHGYASLAVNYRGSTGYGQKFADAILKDQDGAEAKDVLAAVNAALARHSWIDPQRLGIEGISYGGQLTNWIITQTARFRAAIPAAGISNLVSFNYMAYYHDYLAVEFGTYPHQHHLMDLLWQRSALRYVDRVKTPVMFIHGENDNDVPIAEAEQYYIALKDVGVETVMLRYPREGHIVNETRHVADLIDRSMVWYDRHFNTP